VSQCRFSDKSLYDSQNIEGTKNQYLPVAVALYQFLRLKTMREATQHILKQYEMLMKLQQYAYNRATYRQSLQEHGHVLYRAETSQNVKDDCEILLSFPKRILKQIEYELDERIRLNPTAKSLFDMSPMEIRKHIRIRGGGME
jgi:hypothetical protein